MKTTWIDLTDIEQWPGHHGGTQRVVYGIAKKYYLSKREDVRFFAYSPAADCFYETSFTPIYERVERLKEQTNSTASIQISFKYRIKQRLIHYMPSYVKNNKQLKHSIKTVAKRSFSVAKRINDLRVKYFKEMQSRSNDNGPQSMVNFLPSDTILILGKPWDNPGLQKLLMRQKSNTSFKVVQVVYDLIISLYPHLHHPSLFSVYTQHMFNAVAVSDLMLPISESSSNDLKEFCNILQLPIPNISVIRLGDEIELSEDIHHTFDLKPDLRIEDQFLLCVGTIENRKNHMLLYQAYKLADERKIDLPQLLIVGSQGWLADDVMYLITHDAKVSNKIIILNDISDTSLAWLYQNCLFTVYPSLYEGWGLPVAESLAYGKLCVSSNKSSMPEIAGDLLEYFSPNSTDECLEAIQRMLNSKERVKKEEKIAKLYKKTTWSKTYAQVEALCSSL